jgi:peptide/nickel transport system substrate-binding protein/oligopeptide transport system substrate-binding protein
VLGFAALAASCSDDNNTSGAASTTADTASTEESSAVSSPPADAETFSFSVALSEPAALDPALIFELEGGQVARLLFQNLVTLSPELELQPGVAKDWSVADDGVTWTFNLDPAARYSDGRPVVADDFVFAFARAADPDLAATSAYQGLPIAGWSEVSSAEASGSIGDEPLSGVTAVDDVTLTVVTEQPFALLPKVLTYPLFAPVPEDFVHTEDKAASFAEQPVGNGPYMMAEPWKHNESIKVVRNPEFTGEPGRADSIEFRIFSDFSTAVKDFEAGNLDLDRRIPAEDVADTRAAHPDTFIVTRTGVLTYIGFPTTVAPFDNPDIRRALSMAIDREALADRVWEGTQSAATGVVPPLAPGALEGTCEFCEYDPDAAKALFDAAGGIPGNSMVVYDIADDGTAGLDPIVNSWKQVFGIEIEVRSFEFGQFIEETAVGSAVGPFELGWAWDYPSGYSFLSPLFESTSEVNNFGWASTEFDEQMRQAREADDEEAGLEFLAAGQRIVEADVPLAPVTFADEIGVHSDRITNVLVDAGALWRLELIEPAT